MVTMYIMKHENHSNLIDKLGGTSEVARLCRVSSQAVSKWKREGIPQARLMYLNLISKELVAKHEQETAVTPENIIIDTNERRAHERRDGDRRDGDRRKSERRKGDRRNCS